MNKSAIYCIKNLVNGKCYVGSAVDISKRKSSHWKMLQSDRHHSKKLQNSWNKYGGAVFTFEVIEIVEERKSLISREQHWIDLFQSAGERGYNIAQKAGSSLGVKHTEETRAKVSAANRNRKYSPVPEERRAIISAALKGRKREYTSPEHRAHLAEALTGKKHTPESRAKMSAAHRNITPETRLRMSEGQKRRQPPTEETRLKLSLAGMGRKMDPASIAKTAAANRGRKNSPESCARMAQSARNRYARQRAAA